MPSCPVCKTCTHGPFQPVVLSQDPSVPIPDLIQIRGTLELDHYDDTDKPVMFGRQRMGVCYTHAAINVLLNSEIGLHLYNSNFNALGDPEDVSTYLQDQFGISLDVLQTALNTEEERNRSDLEAEKTGRRAMQSLVYKWFVQNKTVDELALLRKAVYVLLYDYSEMVRETMGRKSYIDRNMDAVYSTWGNQADTWCKQYKKSYFRRIMDRLRGRSAADSFYRDMEGGDATSTLLSFLNGKRTDHYIDANCDVDGKAGLSWLKLIESSESAAAAVMHEVDYASALVDGWNNGVNPVNSSVSQAILEGNGYDREGFLNVASRDYVDAPAADHVVAYCRRDGVMWILDSNIKDGKVYGVRKYDPTWQYYGRVVSQVMIVMTIPEEQPEVQDGGGPTVMRSTVANRMGLTRANPSGARPQGKLGFDRRVGSDSASINTRLTASGYSASFGNADDEAYSLHTEPVDTDQDDAEDWEHRNMIMSQVMYMVALITGMHDALEQSGEDRDVDSTGTELGTDTSDDDDLYLGGSHGQTALQAVLAVTTMGMTLLASM